MIDISLFGTTTVATGGAIRGVADFGGTKPRQLLEILAVELGTPISKHVLAERLWEGNPPVSFVATVESYVCGLRRRLFADLEGVVPLVTTRQGYFLDPSLVSVDLATARDLLDTGRVEDVERVLRLAERQLLADDPYAAWANDAREQLATRLAEASVVAARRSNLAGDPERAARLARAGVDHRDWAEPALRELMTGLVRTGNHSRALFEYERVRTRLRDELGIQPSRATQELYLEIIREPDPVAAPRAQGDIGQLLGLLRHALESGVADLGERTAMREVGTLLLARAS